MTEMLANYTGLNEARQKLIIVSDWTGFYHFSLGYVVQILASVRSK